MENNTSKSPIAKYALVFGLGAGILLLVLSRLPQLCSDGIVLDGDEAILGLMAKHTLEGASLPLFFYGQSFSLSIFETLCGAVFFKIFGISEISLKAAMLCLWAIGWCFFVLALRSMVGTRTALMGGILFIVCPAWSSWSMMARGHYISGFAITGFCCWVASHLRKELRLKSLWGVLFGLAIGLLFVVNELWFVALSFFVATLLWHRVGKIDILFMAIGFILPIAILKAIPVGTSSTYWAPNFFENPDILQSLSKLPKIIFVCLSGAYNYHIPLKQGVFTQAAGGSWVALFLFCIYRFIRQLILRKPHSAMYTGCILAMVSILMCSLMGSPDYFSFRHLIPVTPFLVCCLGIELGSEFETGGIIAKKWLTVMLIVVIIGAGALFEARINPIMKPNLPNVLSEKQARVKLIDELNTFGIRYVYSTHANFQWNLIFLSHEKIIARWLHPRDRVPAYPMAVDKAFYDRKPVALVGEIHTAAAVRRLIHSGTSNPKKIRLVGGRYFWVLNPDLRLLVSLGFHLNNPEKI